ncbi:hypothetical protein AGMMS49543_10620 [Betaproteobacteria bacterium]|nr:hypothetical protein AGMMS49543_10620 [Betaproteobacteria bacterium]GHU20061.1 hypothetical protein AGMMS50243_13600 [Betaproteobacteria bacterium]
MKSELPEIAGWIPWGQTERLAHLFLGRLIAEGNPAAAAVLHYLCSASDRKNRVTGVSHWHIGEGLGYSRNTVIKGLAYLAQHNWIKVISNGEGMPNDYVINPSAFWSNTQSKKIQSDFGGSIVAPPKPPEKERPKRKKKAKGKESETVNWPIAAQ